MKDSQEHIVRVAHVPEKHAPYYVGWVRQVYEIVGRPPHEPLSVEAEEQALAKLQQHREDWQIKQARHALRLYRYFLSLQGTVDKSQWGKVDHEAWREVEEKVGRVMRLQHKSLQTEKSHLMWLRRFESFSQGKPLGEVGEDEVTRFLSSLAVEGNVSITTQKQALTALVFVFRCGLERDPGKLSGAVQARYRRRIPTVLTTSEVHQLLDKRDGVPRLMAQLIYGSGLRLFECLRLRVKDVDLEQCALTVHAGKGDKDRMTVLPESLAPPLMEHLRHIRRLHDEDRAQCSGS